ncbi:PMP-22/EMP/MP20/Claudin superfamily [Trinorchestia longiramus]|nr:PMP-22/EMP/MP20/Claudin superfamily [Trinorchestia longiramus]
MRLVQQMVGADSKRRVMLMLSPVLALMSAVLTCSALLGGSWLLTEERLVSRSSGDGQPRQYTVKKTESGLFQMCQSGPDAPDLQCEALDYSNQHQYRLDPNDATLSIPYTAVRSSPFFLLGAALLAVAEVLWLWGHVRRQGAGVCTFVAGVVFIVQGLIMMMGCVMYISTMKGEVWHKLWPKSTHSPALFVYSYGGSFMIMIVAFTCSELAGFSLVMLFIYWHIEAWQRSLCGTPPAISSALAELNNSLIPVANLKSISASSAPTARAFPSDCHSCGVSQCRGNDLLFPNISSFPPLHFLTDDGRLETVKNVKGGVHSSERCRERSSVSSNCMADIHYADSDVDDSAPENEIRPSENILDTNKDKKNGIQNSDKSVLDGTEHFSSTEGKTDTFSVKMVSDGRLVPVVINSLGSQEVTGDSAHDEALAHNGFSGPSCCCRTRSCCVHCCRQQKQTTKDTEVQTD